MENKYEDMVDKVLNNSRFSVFKITEKEKAALLEKLNYIDEIVMLINNNNPNHSLHSTQLVAWIIYDFLRSAGSIEE